MSLLDRASNFARTSVTLKLIIIGFLILMLLIPTSMIDSLIYERQGLRNAAQREVAASYGGQQTIGGPVVSVPYAYVTRTTRDDKVVEVTNQGWAHFLPDRIAVDGQVDGNELYRGIYVVALYGADLRVTGSFDRFNAAALSVPETSLRWVDALLTIGIEDMTGIASQINATLGDSTYRMGPGTVTQQIFQSGTSAPVVLTGEETDLSFSFDLDLNGSSGLYFRPFGRQTNVNLTSDWSNPSFAGGFLPDEREVSGAGFTANWQVLELNRNYPQQGTGSYIGGVPVQDYYEPLDDRYGSASYAQANGEDRFGVRFLLPVDEYKKIYRSNNYAVLFIFITFLTFFFMEVLNGRRVHPIQYLLIGAAIILFYVLLLSISEHLNFDIAYWVSCAAIVGLITTYAYSILRNTKLTGLVATLLIVLYIFFYSLLQLQDYALLIGSLGLLLILAAIMYLTRNIDWYNLNRVGEEEPTG